MRIRGSNLPRRCLRILVEVLCFDHCILKFDDIIFIFQERREKIKAETAAEIPMSILFDIGQSSQPSTYSMDDFQGDLAFFGDLWR